jgi:hypothetical protein
MHLAPVTVIAMTMALAASAGLAQTSSSTAPATPPAAAKIGYATVAEALKQLEAKDGNGAIVTHPDGWTIVNEPAASAQWSFTPAGYFAHPAVVRRVIKRDAQGGVSVEIASLCEAKEADCKRLVTEFEALNDRIIQATKARGRSASTPPPSTPPPPR